MSMGKFIWFVTASLIASFTILFWSTTPIYAATTVDLLTTKNFAVFAKTSVSDVPTSAITGDVGLSDGANITGLTCSEVTGTIYDGDGGYGGVCRVTDAAKLTTAETDLVTAANDASGRTPTTTFVSGDNQLGGQTLTPGVYAFGHATTANITGTLVLDGQGDPNAVWIFQASSDLVTASSSVVSLINSAQACNVFWVVSSQATLGSGSTFVGTIMAGTSVIIDSGATLNGRALARTAAVTLDSDTISVPVCSTTSSTSSPLSSGPYYSDIPYCPPIDTTVVAPMILESKRVSATSVSLSWGPYSGTNLFNVRYGFTNGQWLFSTNVTGFSTTINDLPANQPVWVQVAARNECQVGTFESPVLIGSPKLPNTGYGTDKSFWYVLGGVILTLGTYFISGKVRENNLK